MEQKTTHLKSVISAVRKFRLSGSFFFIITHKVLYVNLIKKKKAVITW